MADVALPQGYAVENAVALPQGYTAEPPQEPSILANAITGVQNGVGNLFGAPHAIADLADRLRNEFGTKVMGRPADTEPGFVTRHTYSPSDINGALYSASGTVNNAVGLPAPQPYEPTTPEGRLGQNVLGSIVPSLVGGSGVGGLISRLAAGAGGTTAGTLYGQAVPDEPAGQLAASLLGGGAAAATAGAGMGLGNRIARPIWPDAYAAPKVANEIAGAAGVPGSAIAATVDRNLPQWTPGTEPTLGNVTNNPGIRNLEYLDQARASRAGDTTYAQNAYQTNSAQRSAVTAATPDTASLIRNLTAARDQAVNAIPPGATAQEAGQALRENLQSVLDQRTATRAAGGSAFDALETSPAQINLRPIMDYATEQAAKNAGEVGAAYQRAMSQFKSASGITLDTAPFANSALKGLGDLAASYPRGSAAARAVLDVKGRLEAQVGDQVPEIAQARAAWAQNSRPLDVFEAKPFAQVLATDRFGRAYAMPNDAVASAFLKGTGSADSLDALHQVFNDPQAATRSLQDYIAGQVRQNALRSDGSVDIASMQRTVQPYQAALMRFPDLRKQFSTIAGAQQALDQQTAYGRLYDTFRTGLGTMEQDMAGNAMYSPAQFSRAVEASKDLIQKAYGPQDAATILRVDRELQSIAQTSYARVKGQSGTPQALTAAGHESGGIGGLVGSVAGALLEHIVGAHSGGAAGAIVGSKLGEAMTSLFGHGNEQVMAAVDNIRRQALTDPAYARNLLMKYQPSLPSSAARRAMAYVANRTPGFAAGEIAASENPREPSLVGSWKAPAWVTDATAARNTGAAATAP